MSRIEVAGDICWTRIGSTQSDRADDDDDDDDDEGFLFVVFKSY